MGVVSPDSRDRPVVVCGDGEGGSAEGYLSAMTFLAQGVEVPPFLHGVPGEDVSTPSRGWVNGALGAAVVRRRAARGVSGPS